VAKRNVSITDGGVLSEQAWGATTLYP